MVIEIPMFIQICVAVAVAAFVVLVVFLIQTLRSVSTLLAQSNVTIKEIQQQLHTISTEATELLRHTNEVTLDVRNKLHSIDPVVYSVKHIGDAVQDVTSSLKQASATVASTIRQKVAKNPSLTGEKTASLLQAVPVILNLWNTLRKKKDEPKPQKTRTPGVVPVAVKS